MLIAFSLIIFFLCTAFVISIYSLYTPFIENFWNIKTYTIAYYWALGSVERAELAIKFHNPWFEGESGEIDSQTGSLSDKKINNFGVLSQPNNGTKRKIRSTVTGNLPTTTLGNTDLELRSWDSQNFNKLDYFSFLDIRLDRDDTINPADYYSNSNIIMTRFQWDNIRVFFRTPPLVQSVFSQLGNSELCDTDIEPECDIKSDDIFNETAVDRKMDGQYQTELFTILPNEAINTGGKPETIMSDDSHIRENTINENWIIWFSNVINPIINNNGTNQYHIVTGNDNSFSGQTFSTILSNSSFTNLSLFFAIANPLRTQFQNQYPLLEYQFEFCNWWECTVKVPDIFYTIEGIAKIGAHQVIIQIKKPIWKKKSFINNT